MTYFTHFSKLAMVCVACLVLSGCAETQFASIFAKQVNWPGQAVSQGKYKVGKPYKIAGQWYYPQENFNLVQSGIASWYGPNFHGKHTANGEVFDQNELTAAHKTLPMPSLIRVTNLENGRSLVLRVNDRGPFSRGRILDVSKRGAELLGFKNQGTARVRIAVLEKESRQMAEAAKRGLETSQINIADLQKMPSPKPETEPRAYRTTNTNTGRPQRPPEYAVLKNDAEMLPESLITPTITVEELKAPTTPVKTYANKEVYTANELAAAPIQGKVTENRFMPAAVVKNEPVYPTALYVQAGAFSVYDNAMRLSNKLKTIAPTVIDPVNVNGRKLYRVKLGPLSNITTADRVLSDVIKAGNTTAHVVK